MIFMHIYLYYALHFVEIDYKSKDNRLLNIFYYALHFIGINKHKIKF